MKKEYYYLIGGLLVGGVAAFMIAKNKFQEPTSGFMVTDMGKNRKHRKCLDDCKGMSEPAFTECVKTCSGIYGR